MKTNHANLVRKDVLKTFAALAVSTEDMLAFLQSLRLAKKALDFAVKLKQLLSRTKST